MKAFIALCISTAAAALAVVAFAPAASAHSGCWLTHGDDRGCLQPFHTALRACDNEVDGNRVRAWYRTSGGSQDQTDWAPSGGCSPWKSMPATVIQVRLCEEDVSCTAWQDK